MGKNIKQNLAILVGGGPAPGINGVIRSVTIEAINRGFNVFGISKGFEPLLKYDPHRFHPLQIQDVTRIHTRGGSILGTSRLGPGSDKALQEKVWQSLQKKKITHLVTIGGDGTSTSAAHLQKLAKKKLSIAHVPKTIDNDLPLTGMMPTFGFHTARHYGVIIVEALMADAKTLAHRWYFVISMGRQAGHLALGIGKAAGATLTLIPEEFPRITLKQMAHFLFLTILKRLAMGKTYGVVVLAEGLAECIAHSDEGAFTGKRDKRGLLRYDETDLGDKLKSAVEELFHYKKLGVSIVSKNIGYELRCMPPIPFDCEYTQDLGYSAVTFLRNGGKGAMISILRGGSIRAVPFEDMLDPKTGRIRPRFVDITSQSFLCARDYMIRPTQEDLKNKKLLNKMSELSGMNQKKLIEVYQEVLKIT